jgi:hypothetical protein
MTRRRLLLLLGAVLGVLGSVWWNRRGDVDRAAARLTQAVGARASAGAVGQAVLPMLPTGTSAGRLILDIAHAMGSEPPGLADMAEIDLRERLQALIRAEHRAGNTVSVQGWELSSTEARLYALVALG